MGNKVDVLLRALRILLHCISFGMLALYFPQFIGPPESTKNFLPSTACTLGVLIDCMTYLLVCISQVCSVVTIVLTIQSIFRKNGHSDIVVTSGIGISTIIAGLSCFTYIFVRFFIRWKLSTNGCEHPNDNFLDIVRIVAVGTGCHVISMLLFGIWSFIPRNDSSFKDNNNNNGKSLLISVWALSNHVTIVNSTNDRTLQYCHV